jgi:predicted O-methyltransferase YrrM
MSNPAGPILDPRVNAVIDRLEAARHRPADGGPMGSGAQDPHLFADRGFSIQPAQGDLIYLLCRSIGAKRVVEFATSVGMSST